MRRQRRLDEAIAYYKRAIELDGRYARAHTHFGSAFKDSGQQDIAIECYQRAIDTDPSYALAHFKLANHLTKKIGWMRQSPTTSASWCWIPSIERLLIVFNRRSSAKVGQQTHQRLTVHNRHVAIRPVAVNVPPSPSGAGRDVAGGEPRRGNRGNWRRASNNLSSSVNLRILVPECFRPFGCAAIALEASSGRRCFGRGFRRRKGEVRVGNRSRRCGNRLGEWVRRRGRTQ